MTTILPPIDHRLHDLFSFESLRQAYESYKERKSDYFNVNEIEIPMGADGVTHQAFEKELERNLINIRKRVLNGTYLFYPFREIDIPKPDGGIRTLSIASIRDIIVQQQIYKTTYPTIEKLFKDPSVDYVSFAYRKGKSSPQAALYLHKYISNGYCYVLDTDIVKYFDNLSHKRLLSILSNHIDDSSLTYKLIRRFLRTDRVPFDTYKNIRIKRLNGKEIFRKIKPKRCRRIAGVPQGGILSGMLANLYLYDFDVWIMNDLKQNIDLQYIRYADDFIILVKQDFHLEELRHQVSKKLKNFELCLHTEKTKALNIRECGLNFVGFHFTDTTISISERNIKKFQERFSKKIESDISWNQKFKSIEHRVKELILRKLNYKIYGVQDTCKKCLLRIEERPKSWISYFSVTTDILQLKKLDKWIREQISIHFLSNYRFHVKRKNVRKFLASIEKEYYSLRKKKICRCITNNNENDVLYDWSIIE
jgi:retron-type reverse transcriptase